ncbi:MBL fold metallo-hydrolase [Actinoplanes bogorensis]|uniref:MBL fold metallo-hydrolase n=1 Tax=Paractinoplanes bogorensis TaxID=1610840 RepID=A0ABS5YXC4_9ACTN|nr:MBL fold metallo-hydrolase [Actinoplanes bogorensis]MBU2668033.1 MBL fold metallo-hydrolase [Actinoplanes bogorensis]
MGDLRLTRRLLFTAGAGALGVTVLGSCSSSSPPASSTPSSASPEAPVPAASGAVAGDWRRVDISYVAAYILVREGEAAIVDLGIPGSQAAIEDGLKAAGAGWGSVKHIVLTHLHDDHVGGLAEIAPLVKANIYAGTGDLSSIISPKPLKPLADGDEVFGMRIVDTPGHTLGHISVFEPSTGVLVAGDALRFAGRLENSDPQYTADLVKADETVRKLAAMDIRAILPGHGEPVVAGASAALKELVTRLPS